jgi:hypothetical protein
MRLIGENIGRVCFHRGKLNCHSERMVGLLCGKRRNLLPLPSVIPSVWPGLQCGKRRNLPPPRNPDSFARLQGTLQPLRMTRPNPSFRAHGWGFGVVSDGIPPPRNPDSFARLQGTLQPLRMTRPNPSFRAYGWFEVW